MHYGVLRFLGVEGVLVEGQDLGAVSWSLDMGPSVGTP